ncbi:N(4)-(beta-N-acetylglucosaminyl)-L-asparaginase [Tahibacter amnicola]|uniref:N(4)-(Beta-N-acetylglucosaminyl)-L-asparaginase n=1 Tax=Tahibacter amnicola TaxID=2976241 RepID=A0ABY6BK86_9GAMM|nr:N(4)-(beta-N-acetylglucosaminyl)-L-asparaginase [Tahibacter amnicola]UXI70428.1 N(4)-(beta-N-acetylglucosaminyl)-L-asparaginase [Tahibacter amnicola]
MTERREVLRALILAGSAALSPRPADAGVRPTRPRRPRVLSTWDFGIAANHAAWERLNAGGTVLDAAETGARIPEADLANHSVGKGGYPDRDGIVTLDASIMDGDGRCGAVAGMEDIAHPISVARRVMEKTPHVLLVGAGARQFAIEQGFAPENLLTAEAEAAWREWRKTSRYEPVINRENVDYRQSLPGGKDNHDTIGLLVVDAQGRLAGACTTSGMAWKRHGRVGDSPVIGAGLYVDNAVGAATSTGVGEEVIRTAGSFLVVELMRQGRSPQRACEEAVRRIVRRHPDGAKTLQVGFLALGRDGEVGAYAIQPGFTYAVCDEEKQDRLVSAPSFHR